MVENTSGFDWDQYFRREKTTFFQRILSLHRRIFISRAVKLYTQKYFKESGVFLEAGAGTSQSSMRMSSQNRILVALDSNFYVLAQHNILPKKLQGNILSLPIKKGCLDGIWNIGVMEHLTDSEIQATLMEFRRAMKEDAVLLMFWPPFFAPFQIILKAIAGVMSGIFRKRVDFFPNEINLYESHVKLTRFLDRSGFCLVKKHFNILDLFSYVVVVAKKKELPEK